MYCDHKCTGVSIILITILQHGGVPGDVLDGGQQVVLHPHEKAPFLPWVLEVQRLEVISETSFTVAYYSNQAEVAQFFTFIKGALLPLKDDGHVELLDDQVHHLPCTGAGGD